MKVVLVCFHSNADCERVFSLVDKTKTKQRASLATTTISNLITHKVAMQSRELKCYMSQYSSTVLRKAKQATYVGLNK